jgi:hypothetical protein
MFPVMFAVNTCPRERKLTASTRPVTAVIPDMSARRSSLIRCIIWRCSNRRRGRARSGGSSRRVAVAGVLCSTAASARSAAPQARLRKHGSRKYVQVLRLIETFDLSEVTHAVEQALKLGTLSFDAVRHLLLCLIERRPPRLDMKNYPHLPLAQVHTRLISREGVSWKDLSLQRSASAKVFDGSSHA